MWSQNDSRTLTSYLQRQHCIYYGYHSDFISTKTILYLLRLSLWLHIYKDNIVFITAITLTSYLQRQYCIYYSYHSDFTSTKTILYLLQLSLWLHIYKDNIVFITAITLTSYLQRQYCILQYCLCRYEVRVIAVINTILSL
jgi:ascorbate-specific PTS system EIIC-type component UlaA